MKRKLGCILRIFLFKKLWMWRKLIFISLTVMRSMETPVMFPELEVSVGRYISVGCYRWRRAPYRSFTYLVYLVYLRIAFQLKTIDL
jgi:hypothetical protein